MSDEALIMDDRARWNSNYLAGDARSPEPDPLLIEACSDLKPGRALDLAGGAGRNAIWLAQRGWRVLLTDVSDHALAIAAQRSAEAGVTMNMRREAAAETLAPPRSPQDAYDLIAVFWFLAREHFTAIPRLLAPGGMLLYKTFTAEHPRFNDGKSTRFALQPGEIQTAFPGLEILLYREAAGVAELVARAR